MLIVRTSQSCARCLGPRKPRSSPSTGDRNRLLRAEQRSVLELAAGTVTLEVDLWSSGRWLVKLYSFLPRPARPLRRHWEVWLQFVDKASSYEPPQCRLLITAGRTLPASLIFNHKPPTSADLLQRRIGQGVPPPNLPLRAHQPSTRTAGLYDVRDHHAHGKAVAVLTTSSGLPEQSKQWRCFGVAAQDELLLHESLSG